MYETSSPDGFRVGTRSRLTLYKDKTLPGQYQEQRSLSSTTEQKLLQQLLTRITISSTQRTVEGILENNLYSLCSMFKHISSSSYIQ